ncbi:endonuclease/exonuclease/phosphatase family protein, partial [Klebsiella pneumoniae]|uniref:endonuclease/exonuclease/phosphatase family protein n=1 Tax=Klebsiella pneumoniae TaxID=573 RepID=UPI004053472C
IKIQPDDRTLRIAVRVVFKDAVTGNLITFFLSHWPSIRSADEKIREDAAESLRNNVNKILDDHGIESQIICMGDYNTNPYSVAIKNKRKLLFNPFWYLLSDKKTNNLGTYHYKSGASNRWFVFDQMLFSSSFIYGGKDCLKLDMNSLDFHRILSDDNQCLDQRFFNTFD